MLTAKELKDMLLHVPDDTRILVNYPEMLGDGYQTGAYIEEEAEAANFFGRNRELVIDVKMYTDRRYDK